MIKYRWLNIKFKSELVNYDKSKRCTEGRKTEGAVGTNASSFSKTIKKCPFSFQKSVENVILKLKF